MIRQLYNLVSIQFKEYFREPGVIFWSFFFPIVIAWVLGIAFDKKGDIHRVVSVAVESKEEERISKNFIERHYQHAGTKGAPSGSYEFIYESESDAIRNIKKGKINLYLKYSAKRNELTYFFDPQNSDAYESYLTLKDIINKKYPTGLKNSESHLVAKGSRYIDFFIPGLIAMQIMNSCLWGIGWTLIELRMKKLMRRMYATPMNRGVFMFAYFIARIILSAVETVLLYVFARVYFDIEIQGTMSALIAVLISGNAVFTGIAILMSSRTSSSRVGNGIINAVTLPMMILSGIFFSYHNFPESTIPFISKLPLTMLADSLRSVFIEGAGLVEVWFPVAVMTLLGGALAFVGLKIFKWY